MVNDRPNVAEGAKYSIKQAAEKLGISRSTLYRYVEKCLIKPVYNVCNNRPMIYGSEILRLWGAELR